MRKIDITTTQNVTIAYDVAPLRDRIFAFLIDQVIIFAFLTVVMWPLLTLVIGLEAFGFIFLLIEIPCFIMYTLLSEVIMHGQTFGKKALGIKVVKLNGKQPTISDYFIRWSFRLVDIWFSLGGLAVLLISSTTRHQRLGEVLSDTVVIQIRPNTQYTLQSILKQHTLENYTLTYPDIVNFHMDDIMTIKVVETRVRQYPNAAHYEVANELATRMAEKLGIPKPKDNMAFLKTLVSDYIVLTR